MAQTGISNLLVQIIVLVAICFFVSNASRQPEHAREKRMSELFGKRDPSNEQKRYFGAFRSAPSSIMMETDNDVGAPLDQYRKRMSEMFGKRQSYDVPKFPRWFKK